MALFNLFRKPIIIQDAFFGRLHFVELKKAKYNYFEGEGHFTATNEYIEYLIVADKNGPTEEQKQFYLHLQSNFNTYVQKIKPLIEKEILKWEKDFKIVDFDKEFKLVCITIPSFDNKPIKWELDFEMLIDLDHYLIVNLIDQEPVCVCIDG